MGKCYTLAFLLFRGRARALGSYDIFPTRGGRICGCAYKVSAIGPWAVVRWIFSGRKNTLPHNTTHGEKCRLILTRMQPLV